MRSLTEPITFLFTDIEGSTRLWESHPKPMRQVLAEHDRLLRQVIQAHHGEVFKTIGDAFCAAFLSASDALTATQEAQRQLETLQVADQPLRVRMALHTGQAERRDSDYFGQPLNRVARLLSIAHGGQVLLSQATYEFLPEEFVLRDLGLHRLKDLQQPEHVWQLSLLEFPPLRSLTLENNNLPQQVTSFVGREKELIDIKQHLARTRLVTLTGSGGCGKTRIALQATAELLDQFPDGAWLVELAPLSDPALVPATVAEVLKVREVPGQALIPTLVGGLRDKNLLILLDNCEHVLHAAASLAEALLRGCPHVRLLVSSREMLGISGEQTYRVPSLSLPDPRQAQTPESLHRYESARLLIERAFFHQPLFVLTEDNASAVAALCARLDGIPLAIELAAARVRSMPVEQLASRLDDRFRLLTGGSRTALPRQQTLRALIDWSYDLLEENQKTLLCRLSVFAGGWTLESAERVCAGGEIEDGEVLDLLTALMDKSLVLYDEDSQGRGRYRLLETVREYAMERLLASGEASVVRLQHRDVLTLFAEEATTHLSSAEQGHWLLLLDQELENCRQALSLSLPDPDHCGVRLATALCPYLIELRGYLSEGSAWLEQQLQEASALPDSLTAKARLQLGQAYWRQGKYSNARAQLEEALRLWTALQDHHGIAQTIAGLANVTYYQGDYDAAEPLYTKALELARQSGNVPSIARALNNCALVASSRHRWEESLALFEESLQLRHATGDRRGEGTVLGNLVAVYQALERLPEAQQAAQASLAIGEELSEPLMQGYAWMHLGGLALSEGDFTQARAAYGRSLAIRHEIGERYGVLNSLEAFMRLVYQEGNLIEAAELLGVVDTLRGEMETQVSSFSPEAGTRWRADLEAALTPERFAHHYTLGRHQPRDPLIAALSSRRA